MAAVACGALAALAAQALADASVAEQTFAKGRALLKQGKYEEACAAFAQSQALDPQFGTLYNLASCDEQIGKLASAWSAFKELAHGDSNAERRKLSAAEAKKLEPRIPHVVITLPAGVTGAAVTLDGQDVTNLVGVAEPIDLGKHVVGATAGDDYTASRKFDAKDEGATIEIELPKRTAGGGDAGDAGDGGATAGGGDSGSATGRAGSDGGARPTGAGGGVVDHADTGAGTSSRAHTGKLLTITGGGVLIAGLAVGGYALSQYDGAKTESDPATQRSQSHDAVVLGDVSTAAVIAGAVVAVVGVYLWRTAPAPFVAPRAEGGATVGVTIPF